MTLGQIAILASAEIGQGLVHQIAERFGLDGRLLVSNMLSFLVVAFFLHRFAYKPVLEMLDRRRRIIQESLEQAEQIKQQLQETEQQRQKILREAQQKAEDIIREARQTASELLEIETKRALKTAEEIIDRAKQAAQIEAARVRAELRREAGRLIVEVTAKVLQRTMTDQDQRRLLEEAKKVLAETN